MIKKITHRLGWKILSVVLAFFLWLIVVNYEDPTITDEFTLTVEKQNATAITSQNKEIRYKEGQTVNVTVRGKRSIMERLLERDIKAYADLSKMSITGAIDIDVVVPEGITIVHQNPSDMTIALENIIKVQKEVQYYFEGEVAEFYEALDPVITPNIVQITGPESLVNQISSVVVAVTISNAKKDITLYATPQLQDNSKDEVKGVTVNVDRVSVMVPIEKTKTIPIIVSPIEDLTEGYVITNTSQDITSITIRGKESAVDEINSIVVNNISLANVVEDTTVPISLTEFLPEGVIIKNNENFVNVSYVIKKLEERPMTILTQDIIVKNIPEGLKFSYIDDEPIEIILKGIQTDLDTITLETLTPYIRLFGL
ncbi:MAG: hypothetical protein H7X94_03655, partial [Vallitaleaceae bacterium]|nr:hypothetical protein [Vallitaleaceae bacterium]